MGGGQAPCVVDAWPNEAGFQCFWAVAGKGFLEKLFGQVRARVLLCVWGLSLPFGMVASPGF